MGVNATDSPNAPISIPTHTDLFDATLSCDVDTSLEIIMENKDHPLLGPLLIPVVFTSVFAEIRRYREKVDSRVDVDRIAKTTHDQWMTNKLLLGYHHPDACPHQPKEGNRGCARCHLDLKKWGELNEHVKGRKRSTVRSVLEAAGVIEIERGVVGTNAGTRGGECDL